MAEEPSLEKNKLMWQYLSAGGMDLLAGQPIGANVHQTTMQNMRSQNFAKMLKQLLGNGGKMSMDGQNISFKAPVGAFQGPEGPGSQTALAAPQEAIGLGGGATPGPGVPTDVNQMKPTPSQKSTTGMNTDMLSMLLASGGAGIGNPSASPLDFSSSDLAGLMPEDISSALKFKMAQDEFAQNATEKSMNRALKASELDIEQRKLLQGKDTPTIREYEYAVRQGYKGSIEDYRKEASNPEKLAMYKQAVGQGYAGPFMEWLGEYSALTKPVTNINVGDKVAEQEAMQRMRDRMWFTNPTGMAEDMQKYVDSDSVQNDLLKYIGKPQEMAKAKAGMVSKQIESRMVSSGAKEIKRRAEGKTIVWTVTWDDGRKSEVRYAF